MNRNYFGPTSVLFSAGKVLVSSERLEVFTNGSFVIKSVTGGDDGGYTCTASNRRGLTSSRTANVKVIGRFHITGVVTSRLLLEIQN